MMLGMRFATFRLIVLTLAVASQLCLFLFIRKGIRSSGLSDRSKSAAVLLAGLAICLLFVMNGYNAARPIPWIDPPVVVQAVLFYLPAIWGFGSILSAVLLCLARVVGGLGRIPLRLHGRSVRRDPSPSVDPGRRRFLEAGVAGLAAAPFLLSGYGALYASKACDVRELTLPFGRSLRVVQISDIHAGVYMTREEMGRYTDLVIALQPDLFVLTGDFISNSMVFLPECLEEMVRVKARLGTFAILGNHDNWYGRRGRLRTIFRKYGIPLLVNAHRVLDTAERPFAVVGIDDLRSGHPDLEAALSGLDSATPVLLLSHRPEIFPAAAAHGIPLTLSGHYHGGQIKVRLPGVAISPAHFMTPYPEGLYRINASRLYVSRGIGTTFTPIRLSAPPEVTVFNLT